MSGVYVTGTDTGAGKTFACVALLHALRTAGRTAIGMKPVASGCTQTPQGWRNEDALQLLAASRPQVDYAECNPYALPEATAPQIAAAHAGVELSLPRIEEAYAALAARADVVVVEGVGGWLAPLSAALEQVDLVRALQLPVIVVVGLRLGCINHARLTEAELLRSELPLLGWVASDVDPALDFADEYFAALRDSLHSPCLGRLPHAAGCGVAAAAWRLPAPLLG